MTVSGVSMLVDRLERQYRARLIARRGRAITLTTSGEVLCEYAREMIEAEHRLEHELDFAREIDRGWVRIGATRTIAEQFLAPIVAGFKERHPEMRVSIEAGSVDVVRTLLLNRRIDFACTVSQDHEELTNTLLHRERILIITEPNDELAQRSVVSRDDILRRPFVIADRNTDIRHRVELENALGCTGRAGLLVALEVPDDDAIKQAVRRGLGCGFMPESIVEHELREGVLREIKVEGVSLTEDTCLVRRTQTVLSDAAASLLSAILSSKPTPTGSPVFTDS
jgi:LysR family transcriptional regulator, transcriptional activator of the cysJI operon